MRKHVHSVGVLKEIKDQEKRVGITPHGVGELVSRGHLVHVEKEAGSGAGFSDTDYANAGARVLFDARGVVEASDIVVKVKEPLAKEYYLLEQMHGKTLFTFLHLASNKELADVLLEHEVTGVSYDTIEDDKGKLPLLRPMSEIAGKFAVDFWYNKCAKGAFERVFKNILVVGGGVTGTAAVKRACELGCADVVVFERNLSRALQLEQEFYDRPVDVFVCAKKLNKLVAKADLLVGAVLVKGSKCPIVVTEEMVEGMKLGSKITDVSIDQGGCIFGSKPTSHTDPVFMFKNQAYCCIPNMPGQVPREATQALTDATLPYLLEMAVMGPFQYLVQEPRLIKGINTHAGRIINEDVARDLNMQDKYVRLGQ